LRARPALGVSVGEQQSHYCDTEQNKTDRAHGSSPGPSFCSDLRCKNGVVCEASATKASYLICVVLLARYRWRVNMSKFLLTVCAFGLLLSFAFAEEKSPEQQREESNQTGLQKMNWTRVVASGTNQRIGFFYAVNPDCSASGDINIRVTKQPEHGTVEIAAATSFPNFERENIRYRCNQHEVRGQQVNYKSAEKYVGSDTLELLVLLPGGFAQEVHINIARQRVPAIYPYRFMAADGGLISYGVDIADLYRRAASYIDRILRGANPADQAPVKFELVINFKTAKALALEVPMSLQIRVDGVIE
jgi:hypothetical protein